MFGRRAAPEIRDTVFAPNAPFFAVGDLHGRFDLMEQMLELIANTAPGPIVFLGDYVDRGSDAAGVLRRLHRLNYAAPDGVIALRGNHEAMMLDYIADPTESGARFLRFGGVETLRSFGITARISDNSDDMTNWAKALADALGPDLLGWLRGLPAIWRSGNMICTHAGIEPREPLDQQPEQALIWGSSVFLSEPLPAGQTVVYGHQVVPKPSAIDGRVALDTGAYRTGRLSAAYFTQGSCQFLEVSAR